MRTLLSLGLLVGALAAPASAQVIAIQNARVMTMGPGGVIENGDVLVRNGVIAAVGVDLAVPEGASVIDAAGRVVTPGFFAPYSQIGISEVSADDESNDSSAQGDFPLSAALDVVDAYNPNATAIAIGRAGGVTRALSAPNPGGKLFGGRAAVVDLSGRIGSITKPQAVQFAIMGYGGASRAGDTRMGSWAVMREYLDEAISYAANPRDYALRQRDARFSTGDLKALGAVVNGSQPLMVRVDGAPDIRNLLRLKNDYRLNVIILGGAEAWRVAREIAAANVPVILDTSDNLPASFEDMGATLENAARLNAAGVRIAFECGGNQFMRVIGQSAGLAVANGLPYDAALAALTINPATIFGLEARLGSIEVGKAADIVVWDGDPLEVTTRPTNVLIDGRAMSLENRQTKLRDRYRDLTRGDLPHAYRGAN